MFDKKLKIKWFDLIKTRDEFIHLKFSNSSNLCYVFLVFENSTDSDIFTQFYSAPELWINNGRDWGQSTPENMKKYDVFAAGLVIAELLSNQKLYDFQPDFQSGLPFERVGNRYHFMGIELNHLTDFGLHPDHHPVAMVAQMLETNVASRINIHGAIAFLKNFMASKGYTELRVINNGARYAPKCLGSDKCIKDCKKQCKLNAAFTDVEQCETHPVKNLAEHHFRQEF